jgi:3D-(3,5/4)-trihydroxycyclohexane-1,2-dione acylhydrolase (decyclizing)
VALSEAKAEGHPGPVVIHIETDPRIPAPDGGGWWDVPIAEVSALESVQGALDRYRIAKKRQRPYV